MIVELTPVTSSNLSAIGYEPVSETLAVRFKNGDVWHYHKVPVETFASMKSADSVGSYFSKNVRGKHEATPA